MPLVEVKVFENELSPEQTEEVIQQLTDVMVSFGGEALRDATWVIVEEVQSGSWGVGGNALGLDDIRTMQAEQAEN